MKNSIIFSTPPFCDKTFLWILCEMCERSSASEPTTAWVSLDSSQLHEAKNPSGHKKRIPSRLSKTLLGIRGWGLHTWHSQNRNLDLDPFSFQVTLTAHTTPSPQKKFFEKWPIFSLQTFSKLTDSPPAVAVYLTKLRAFFKLRVNH